MSADIKPPSIATGSPLNAETWSDFVSRLRHDCEGAGVDDHGTADALFVVHKKVFCYGISLDYTDDRIVYCDEYTWKSPQEYWDEADEQQQDNLNFIAKSDHHKNFLELDIEDQWEILGDLQNHTVTGYTERWEYVNSHFTKDAAEAFIKRKKHDYPDGLRVYVESQQYTWEFNAIKDAILRGEIVFVTPVQASDAGRQG